MAPAAESPPPLRRAARALVPAAPWLLAAWALGLSLLSTPFHHDALALVYFAALYAALFTAAWEGTRLAARAGLAGALAGGLALTGLLAFQARWDAELLTGRVAFAATLAGGALLVALLLRAAGFPATERRRRPARGLLALGGASTLFAGLLAGGFHGTEAVRWHLLNHHRLAGHVAYALFSDPIRVVRDALWSSRPRLVEPWERASSAVERPAEGGAGAPNVVLLLVDTLRADSLAAWGGDPALMPFANELASRSFVLHDVTANATWTRASVASIFTGLLPEEHGAVHYHDRLSSDWRTLPEVLSEAGYGTAAFVSNWVQVGVETGFDQGFDAFFELHGDESLAARARYARAADVNARVLAWVRERRAAGGTEPLFLYVHYLDPHSPYLSGPEPGLAGGPRAQKAGAYRQELRYLDGELSTFVGTLEEALGGSTVLVLTSDHGEEFWEHGEWGHGHSLYRELVSVPALVHFPGAREGRLVDARLELRDLFQLVVDLARPEPLDVPAWAAARSRDVRYASQFLDRVADVRPDKKRTALRSVEQDGVEAIWSGYGPTWQLYDRALDPAELDNEADRDPEALARLRGALEEAVRFWTRPPRVERSAAAVEFLQDLGYAGGVHDEP